MKKNKKAIMVKFLVTVLLAIMIFVPGCFFASKFFRLSDQAQDNFHDLAKEIRDLSENGKDGELRNFLVILDPETTLSIIPGQESPGSGPLIHFTNQCYAFSAPNANGRTFFYFNYPQDICTGDACMCLCRDVDLENIKTQDLGNLPYAGPVSVAEVPCNELVCEDLPNMEINQYALRRSDFPDDVRRVNINLKKEGDKIILDRESKDYQCSVPLAKEDYYTDEIKEDSDSCGNPHAANVLYKEIFKDSKYRCRFDFRLVAEGEEIDYDPSSCLHYTKYIGKDWQGKKNGCEAGMFCCEITGKQGKECSKDEECKTLKPELHEPVCYEGYCVATEEEDSDFKLVNFFLSSNGTKLVSAGETLEITANEEGFVKLEGTIVVKNEGGQHDVGTYGPKISFDSCTEEICMQPYIELLPEGGTTFKDPYSRIEYILYSSNLIESGDLGIVEETFYFGSPGEACYCSEDSCSCNLEVKFIFPEGMGVPKAESINLVINKNE
jgi:hypothetical protein